MISKLKSWLSGPSEERDYGEAKCPKCGGNVVVWAPGVACIENDCDWCD